MFPLKFTAILNIADIFVTRDVSHESIPLLNVIALENILLIFVISVVTILLKGTGVV